MKTVGRLLIMGENSAAMNMSIDEAILTAQKDKPNPTLRFYDWEYPAFSFGYFQDIAAEVDVEACSIDNIELVKRMTGGGTVVHGWDLTYSLILPRYTGELGVSEAYKCIGDSLVQAFVNLEIPAKCYSKSVNHSHSTQNICLTNAAEHDVMCNDRKLAGVSVRRNRYGVMFQGYISLDMPPEHILKRVSKHTEIHQTLYNESTAINTQGRLIKRNVLIQSICETFDIGITFNSGTISVKEMMQAETLVKAKYATQSWNFE